MELTKTNNIREVKKDFIAAQLVSKNEDPATTDIYLYGDIASSGAIQAGLIARDFKNLEKRYSKCRVHINSTGGQITEGIAIHNIFINTSMELEFYVDGIAASMAAILIQVPNAKRYMGKYTKIMFHSPTGQAEGKSEDFRRYAQMLDDLEKSIIQIICDRTGFDDCTIKSKWFDNKDHWFSPQEALNEKIIDGIVDGNIKTGPKNIWDPIAIFNYYQEQLATTSPLKIDIEKLIQILGMASNSSEDRVISCIENLIALNVNLRKSLYNLQNEVYQHKKQLLNTYINSAIASNKIPEYMRLTYERLAAKDFETTIALLISLQPNFSVISEERRNWTFNDWQKKDGKGLQDLKDNHALEYKTLYRRSFRKEPT
jgi:ATP-dependent protease ClpP protease subunit